MARSPHGKKLDCDRPCSPSKEGESFVMWAEVPQLSRLPMTNNVRTAYTHTFSTLNAGVLHLVAHHSPLAGVSLCTITHHRISNTGIACPCWKTWTQWTTLMLDSHDWLKETIQRLTTSNAGSGLTNSPNLRNSRN